MRLLVMTEYFPNPFKPYFDEQMATLVARGADVRIVAVGKWAETAAESVRGDDLLSRTRYAPPAATAGAMLRTARAALARPARAARIAGAEWRHDARPRTLLTSLARAVTLPDERPECILVHDLTTLVAFRGVRSTHPDVPIVLWYHGGEIPGSSRLPEPLVRRVLGAVTLAIGNTRYAADAVAARGIPAERTRVLPIGVSAAGFDPPCPRRYKADGTLRLLFVGRLSPEKGVMDILAALGRLRAAGETRVRLRIAGTGPQGEALRAECRRLGLDDAVEFLGFRGRAALADELAAADALVLPSCTIGNFSENQGVVLQEAMLMRLPLVTTRSGGIQESIAPGNRALSVAEHAPEELAERFRALLDAPEARLAALGEEGRRFVLECYEPGALAGRLMGVLAEAMTLGARRC